MKAIQHTPGPWHIGKRAADVAIYGHKGEEVAKILDFFNDDEENKANACLIAAAPELLAALKVLIDCAADLDQSGTPNGMKNCYALAKSRAAIRKAKGNA